MEMEKLYKEAEKVERRYHEGYFIKTIQIRSAHELVERTLSQASPRIANLETMVEKSKAELKDLKAKVQEKEDKLLNISKENKKLKEIMELEGGYLTEEADNSSRNVARVTEELDLIQAENAELKAELRRMKLHKDQWRKAAEEGAAMLSGNNDIVKRTRSLGSDSIGGKLNSPYSEDMEEVSSKKKIGNILKKFGVFMKKGQK